MILSNFGAKLILKYKTNLHTYMEEEQELQLELKSNVLRGSWSMYVWAKNLHVAYIKPTYNLHETYLEPPFFM